GRAVANRAAMAATVQRSNPETFMVWLPLEQQWTRWAIVFQVRITINKQLPVRPVFLPWPRPQLETLAPGGATTTAGGGVAGFEILAAPRGSYNGASTAVGLPWKKWMSSSSAPGPRG